MSRTLEQRRAAFALGFIEQQRGNGDKDKEKLNTHIHKTPSLILQCGLGQALAFLLADAKGELTPSKILYNALQDWLCGTRNAVDRPVRVYNNGELIQLLVEGSRSDYFRAQEESLMLLNWLKKFADAKL